MRQKKIWKHFLTAGIFSFLGCTMSSCGTEDVEYIINADVIYKNETSYQIHYYQLVSQPYQKKLVADLPPNSEKKIEIRGDGGSKKPPEVKDYKGIIADIQGWDDVIIEYDKTKCLTYDSGEGPTTENIASGYEVRKISDRHYEFVYYFTDKEYNQATACN